MRIRPAQEADAVVIASIAHECDLTFAAFAPPGWQPPPIERELENAIDSIANDARWICVAEVGGKIVGYAAFVAAALTRMPVDDPRVAHLGRLFVRPEFWGRHVASALHDAAVRAAASEGFGVMRLFAPTEHGRARRFYEREGWSAVGEVPENELGLPLTEYRRDL